MRHVLRFGWAAALALALDGTAPAQTTGTGSTGTGTSGGSGGISSTPGTNNLMSSIADQTPTIQSFSPTGQAGAGTGQSPLNQSNVLSGFYANPYYQGRNGAVQNQMPGGFASPLYTGGAGGGSPGSQSVSTGSARNIGSGVSTTTRNAGGVATTNSFGGTSAGLGGGGLGGNTGFGATGAGRTGGFGATSGFNTQSGGAIVAMPRQISYTATLRFAPQPIAPTQMQADLRSVLGRSTVLSNPAGVDVLAVDGGNVVLRGAVRDEDEARLAEGMVRLTPGVRDVKNELTFPRTP